MKKKEESKNTWEQSRQSSSVWAMGKAMNYYCWLSSNWLSSYIEHYRGQQFIGGKQHQNICWAQPKQVGSVNYYLHHVLQTKEKGRGQEGFLNSDGVCKYIIYTNIELTVSKQILTITKRLLILIKHRKAE